MGVVRPSGNPTGTSQASATHAKSNLGLGSSSRGAGPDPETKKAARWAAFFVSSDICAEARLALVAPAQQKYQEQYGRRHTHNPEQDVTDRAFFPLTVKTDQFLHLSSC